MRPEGSNGKAKAEWRPTRANRKGKEVYMHLYPLCGGREEKTES